MNIRAMVRQSVLEFEPYVPGKPIQEVQREYGLRLIVKLASNENALGSSPKALAAVRKAVPMVYRYPEGSCHYLRERLARSLKVRPEEIIFGNGSDEIIELLGKTFLHTDDEVVVSDHAFIRYAMAGRLMGARVVSVPMRGYTHDVRAMAEAVTPNTRLVFIANPNNPTGTAVTKAELDDYFARVSDLTITVLDEAYAEFVTDRRYESGLHYFRQGHNVVVLRTFSKIYGLAGLRVGYGVGRADVVHYLDRIRPPFNVNGPAEAAARAALEDHAHGSRSLTLVQKERPRMQKALEALGLEVVPSVANFLLVGVGRSGKVVFGNLLKRGIIVRAMDEYGYPKHIRVTIGRPNENARFLSALKEVLAA